MRIFSILFSCLLFFCVSANAQHAGLTGLRKFSSVYSYKQSYYDSLLTSRATIYLYDKAGRAITFIQMQDKDTTETTVMEYNGKGQMIRKARHWNPKFSSSTDEYGNPIMNIEDSTCDYQYDSKGRLVASHAREYSKTEVYDSAASEYRPAKYVVNWIYKVTFDKQDNPVLERTTKFDMIGKDTAYKYDMRIENVIQYKYNEKDSITSMKRRNDTDAGFSKFEKIQYGPFGRISWQKWEKATFVDSLAGSLTYDSKGKLVKQKIKKFDYDYSAEKRKLASSTEYFYNDSLRLIRLETTNGKEKKTEYLSGTKVDSVAYFENNIRKPEPAKPVDTIPALAREEHYDEMWSDGARLEYDKAGHLVLLAFVLDGFYQHTEYEWEGDRLKRKLWKDRDGTIKQMQEYFYEFY